MNVSSIKAITEKTFFISRVSTCGINVDTSYKMRVRKYELHALGPDTTFPVVTLATH